MGNGKGKIIQMPGQETGRLVLRPDQIMKLRGKMAAAVIHYMEVMQDRTLSRQELIETTANTVTLIINLLSITSDAISLCSAARIIGDRLGLIRNALLPSIVEGIPDFIEQEQGLVDLLVGDTGVVLEIYSAVLDDDQMKSLLSQFATDQEDTEDNGK